MQPSLQSADGRHRRGRRSGDFSTRWPCENHREAKNLGYLIVRSVIDATDEILSTATGNAARPSACGDCKSLEEAIAKERILLQPLREFATIDRFPRDERRTLQNMMRQIESVPDDTPTAYRDDDYGFKRGIPARATWCSTCGFAHPLFNQELGHFTAGRAGGELRAPQPRNQELLRSAGICSRSCCPITYRGKHRW